MAGGPCTHMAGGPCTHMAGGLSRIVGIGFECTMAGGPCTSPLDTSRIGRDVSRGHPSCCKVGSSRHARLRGDPECADTFLKEPHSASSRGQPSPGQAISCEDLRYREAHSMHHRTVQIDTEPEIAYGIHSSARPSTRWWHVSIDSKIPNVRRR